MAREYAFVLRTPSSAAAKRLGKRLRAEEFDVDIDDGARSVWCFADSNDSAGQLRDHLTRLAGQDMVGPPVPLVWREAILGYVDPATGTRDHYDPWAEKEITPDQIRWKVKVTIAPRYDLGGARRELRQLNRPLFGAHDHTIDVAARDRIDAGLLVNRLTALDCVSKAEADELGTLERWQLRFDLGDRAHPK